MEIKSKSKTLSEFNEFGYILFKFYDRLDKLEEQVKKIKIQLNYEADQNYAFSNMSPKKQDCCYLTSNFSNIYPYG